MAISEEEKEKLRQRLEIARASKVAKKVKINQAIAEVDEPSKTKSGEVLPESNKIDDKAKAVDVSKKEVQDPLKAVIPSKPIIPLPVEPKKTKEPKVDKNRFAKIVFYKDPSEATLKKMNNLFANEQEEQPTKVEAVKMQEPINVVPKIDPRVARQKQISDLAHAFFN